MLIAVIPAFNEGKTIGGIIERTRKFVDEVIVVDDGSWDETLAICGEKDCVVLSHGVNKGVGAALRTGINYVRDRYRDPEIIILDSDGQHFPEDIPLFLNTGFDVVIGTRFGDFRGLTVYKKLLNKIASKIASLLAKKMIIDSESGFRYYNKKAVKQISFKSNDYAWATEDIIILSKKGFSISFVSIKTIWGIPSREGQRRRGLIYGILVLFRLIRMSLE